MESPAQSLDLNPICDIKNAASEGRQRNLEGLWKDAKPSWAGIPVYIGQLFVAQM